jgi:acyl carrier protein
MKNPPTFDEFAHFIREFSGDSADQVITPDTQFERDLGVTGDDGDDLLIATEKRFHIQLVTEERSLRETFNMAPNEYLFHSEGGGV